MSDTTAFLTGCAVSGVAALFLLRGGIGGGLSVPMPPGQAQFSAPGLLGESLPSSESSNLSERANLQSLLKQELKDQRELAEDLKTELEDQQELTEDLKTELEDQQKLTEDLKTELEDQQKELAKQQIALEQQQENTKELISQLRDQGDLLQETAGIAQQSSSGILPQNNELQAVLLWSIGGTALIVIVGGGVVLLSVIMLVSRSQKRPQRSPQIVYPMGPSYMFAEPEALPPAQPNFRRANTIDYYDS